VHAHRFVPDKSDRAFRWQRLFRGQESELRQLRHWLTDLLPDSPGRDDLISVAVELGTNAVQHTASGDGGWFTVEVACLGPVMRVSVTDQGAAWGPSLTEDPPRADLDLDLDPDEDTNCDRGRGLIIVRALSVTCGVRGNASGRTVWAEVAQAQIQAARQARRPQTQTQPQLEHETELEHQTRIQGNANGQGRSSRPSASSAMAISRTL
jgi:anti-sigma regulatory factor (Ser/Thr protein kinase)